MDHLNESKKKLLQDIKDKGMEDAEAEDEDESKEETATTTTTTTTNGVF